MNFELLLLPIYKKYANDSTQTLTKNRILALQVVGGSCLVYEFWPSPNFLTVFAVCLVFVQFIIPLFILIYCYGIIVWNLSRRIDSGIGKSGTQSDRQFQLARSNTIKTLLIIAVCFVLCWINNQIYLLYSLAYDADWNGTFYKFTILMIFLNCTVNPFVYLIKYKDYQVALKSCFSCRKEQGRNDRQNQVWNSGSTDVTT